MTSRNALLLVVAVVVALSVNVAVLTHAGIRAPFTTPTPKPDCDLFHVGTTTVEVTYPPSVLVDLNERSVVMLYKKDDPGLENGSAMYVIGISDHGIRPETVDELIQASAVERPGPLYDKKTTFNGLAAALATPSPDYYYYEIPFGNVVIELEYNPRGLSPDDRKLTDAMVKGIRFNAVTDDIKQSRIENCY